MIEPADPRPNFIRQIVSADVAAGRTRVHTRFPPEPNGFLHIGHAKAIWLNFAIAEEFGGLCNLRFDDTNPETESQEFEIAIEEDIRWLGFDWSDRLYHASDYFDRLYEYAVQLIQTGKAYVDDLSSDQIREYRGTLTDAGRESPFRDRSVDENLERFEGMRHGRFNPGECVLRARIDMAAPNINMRDPVLYRIRGSTHHRTGSLWRIFPTYDYTHCICDAIEGITHSLCSLEFEDHRPLYDWILEQLPVPARPRQYEFARLELDFVITSKRRLRMLVTDGHVRGWDDPRMPTLRGLRRRGVPPSALRELCERVGVTKKDSIIDSRQLDTCIREQLDADAPRAMAVIDPVKVIIENYPDHRTEQLDADNHPKDATFGKRQLPFGRELYIEREDFMEAPVKGFFRLSPGREVRLRYAYLITCREVIHDPLSGEVTELRCTYDPESRGGNAPDGRKVKATLHWVAAHAAVPAEIRLFDRLFLVPDPAAEEDLVACLNPQSERIVTNACVEPSLAEAEPESRFQFERLGYFCTDRHDHGPQRAVFNRIVTLRDSK